MKVKLALRFRGREMRFKEFGFKAVNKFIEEAALFATPDSPPKIVGRGITVMLNPLPRNKRASNPKGEISLEQLEAAELEDQLKQDELDAQNGDFEDITDEGTEELIDVDEEIEEEDVPAKKSDNKPIKKSGKQSEFGNAILDDINLEISPKHKH
jgi:hypothetical protein